jgi:hypothetical protein
MLLALFAGIALALGHHLFYQRLDGALVPAGSYDLAVRTVSRQQFNTGVGTAFAFLVKAALTIAVSIAYVQVFWRAAQVADKHPTLAELDTLSTLSNLLGLFTTRAWYRKPLLLFLALTYWYVGQAVLSAYCLNAYYRLLPG